MEYADWAPRYRAIQAQFGFAFDREERSAQHLLGRLPRPALVDPLGRIARRLAGRETVVVGRAPHAGPPPLWRRPASDRPPAVIAADGATTVCLDAGLVPDIIVTDLDGPVASEVVANARGAFVVVHAHGDNAPAIDRWVPEFSGELAGSWAGPPGNGLLNVGGFTDGDRAAFLAEHVGANRILLWGFDFAHVDDPEPAARSRKLAKLRWAAELLGELARAGRVPLEEWRPDGTVRPFQPPPTGPATQ
jgi:uncharacterized Rossmann fold enzyme